MNRLEQLDSSGYTLIEDVYSANAIRDIAEALAKCLDAMPASSVSIASRAGRAYALRNLLDVFPEAKTLWQTPVLMDLLVATLGQDAGLVRGLFFDKPPEATWSLPWHKDMTIAVRDNSLPSDRFRHPTQKAGVQHVEAPSDILDTMLTLRIHLDDASCANGALRVMPGSHQSRDIAKADQSVGTLIEARAGDVLAMRPLLSHCSGVSNAETLQHRRVLHLEFAATGHLPNGFEWHYFQPICSQ